jgi:IS30 family transposase
MRVSHETIYRSLFIQARGVLKRELIGHLRSGPVMRRAKNASSAGQARGQIIDALSIRERPAEIEDRAIPGHWEGDLITGSNNTFRSVEQAMSRRCAVLEARIAVLEKDAERRSVTLSQFIRDARGELSRRLRSDDRRRDRTARRHRSRACGGRWSRTAELLLAFCEALEDDARAWEQVDALLARAARPSH